MGNNTKTPLTIDGVEYDVEKFDDRQKALLNHVVDLDRKASSARFNLDQLQVGRDAFLAMLKQALEEPSTHDAQNVQTVEAIQ